MAQLLNDHNLNRPVVKYWWGPRKNRKKYSFRHKYLNFNINNKNIPPDDELTIRDVFGV